MKRTSRIIALFLVILLLVGTVWVAASATTPYTTTTNGFQNDYEDLTVGSNAPGFGIGAGSSSASTATIQTLGGNRYLRYAYASEPTEKTYRRDLMIGNYANADSDSLTHLSDYSYVTVDFDIAADKYSVFVGYDVQTKYEKKTLTTPTSATVTVDGVDYTVSVTEVYTYTCNVYTLYKNYDSFDEAQIAADIESAFIDFKKELNTINSANQNGRYTNLTYAEGSTTIPATVRSHVYNLPTNYGLPVDDLDAFMINKGYAVAAEVEGVSTVKSAVTVEEAKSSTRLSYSDYSRFQLDARQVSGTTALNKTSGYTTHTVYFVHSNGEWQIRLNGSGSSSYTGFNLADDLGEWNHFTYVIKTVPKLNEATGKYTYGYSEVRLYFNGEIIGTSTNISGSTYVKISDDIVPRAIDWQIDRYVSEYSMCLDNFVATYYPVVEKNTSDPTKNVNYTSGDKNGIDDLFNAESGLTNLAECEDVVYTADYEYPYPNGYVEIDGKKIYVPFEIDKAIKTLDNGAEIKTTLDTLEIDPSIWTALTVKCDPDTVVTLSKDAIARGVDLTKTPTGYSVSSGFKANMSLFTNMRFNLYLPKIDGVEITGVDGALLSEGTVKVLGTEMFLISAIPEVNSFEAIKATVSYTVNGEAKTLIALLDPMSYATAVADTYDCGSEEATLVYEMVKYKEAIATLLSPDFTDASGRLAAFKEIYAAHGDCGCVDTKVNISADENAVDYSALIEKGVLGIQYKLSLNEIGMVINVKDGTSISSVSYTNALGEVISHTEENGKLVKRDGYYLVSGVSAAYIDEIMTITTGDTSGTYCLGKYIKNNPEIKVAESIYTYSVAAERFKNLSGIELTVSVEFLRESAAVDSKYVLEGYYAGSGDEGAETLIKEAYFKDLNSDKIIAVQGISYGADYDFGYVRGDLVKLTVKLKKAEDNHGSKLYAEFIPENNPESIEETIISRGNELNYKLNDAVLIESWSDMQSFFNVGTLETYSYVHIKGTGYINYYSSKDLYRPHMNATATSLATMKPDGSRALAFRGPVLKANFNDADWAAYKSKLAGYPGATSNVHKMELDVYCVVTKVNYYNFILTPLDADWFVDHEHSYEGNWITESSATIFDEGSEYRECTECSIREYRTTPILPATALEIDSAPIKTNYTVGDALDLTGFKISAVDGNGNKYDVTDLITVNRVILNKVREEITVSYAGITIPLGIRVNTPTVGISEIKKNGALNTLYYVDGYIAGFAQNGPGSTIEVLIKDLLTDDIISLTSLPAHDYTKGDRINIYATLIKSTSTHTPNKLLLSYNSANPEDINETVISRGNKITYKLDNVVTLSSFDEWKALFKVGEIDEYTFVKITEPLYASGYKSSNDDLYLARLHTLATDTDVTSAKVDGSRYVSFRDNIMSLNLGTDWHNYFEGNITKTSIRALEFKSKEVVTLYTGANSAYFQLTVLDEDWFVFEPENTEYTLADIVTEIAFAYVNRGNYIQYNQTLSRRQLNASPEDATAQNMIYLDCSSFVNAVYYEAFGINVMSYALTDKIDGVSQTPQTARFRNYARDHQDNPDVVGYWMMKGNTDVAGTLAEIMGSLEAGDVVNYRKGSNDSSGHAMLYIGDGKFIHSTGDDFKDATGNDHSGSDDSDASLSHDGADKVEKTTGTVRYETTYMDALFTDATHTRYLGSQYDVAVIRPIARGVVPTEETVNRMAMRGLYMEKSVDAGISTAVSRGDTITYTVHFNNAEAYARSITITEQLSSSVTFVSATESATVKDGILTITARISPLKSQSISWTVKVNENAEAGALIESRSTKVNEVGLLPITNTVSAYTDAEMTLLAELALEYAASGRAFDDPALMVKTLYKEALGVEVYDFDTALDLLSDLIGTAYQYKNAESEVNDIVAPYLYGGRDVSSMYVWNTDIIRLIRTNNLSVGDAILAYDESEARTVAFVYVGDMTLVKITNDGKACSSVVMTDSIYESSHVLVTLFAYDKYVVLRPSMR